MFTKILIIGGAGFIGSNLAKKISLTHEVTVLDNLSSGFRENLKSSNIKFIKCDLLDLKKLKKITRGFKVIFHLAANADIRFNLQDRYKALEQNAICTFNVLEAMKYNKIKRIIFSSTGSVYGDTKIFPTPENVPIPNQTSLYAASKLYCESLIQSYCEAFGFQAWIFRFASILGPHYSHGHVFDFIKQLKKNKKKLKILGDGNQRKTYLHVDDCINAMILALKKNNKKINVYNLATPQSITVKNSIKIITNTMKLNPKKIFTGGKQGWVGDQKIVSLDIKKIKKLGWKNKISIEDGIEDTAKWILKNKWILNKRK